MFFVYVLRSKVDNKLYIGSTSNITKRLKSHNRGRVLSTKSRRPLELIYHESYQRKNEAVGRELFLKSGAGHQFLYSQFQNGKLEISRGGAVR
ncbi:MAG: GIY-YIG nuclease family protein [Omnitrophica bacterium]|nr:GIY-YIG nuclease family protein [Candidatus Omnitrophota bacterium]